MPIATLKPDMASTYSRGHLAWTPDNPSIPVDADTAVELEDTGYFEISADPETEEQQAAPERPARAARPASGGVRVIAPAQPDDDKPVAI